MKQSAKAGACCAAAYLGRTSEAQVGKAPAPAPKATSCDGKVQSGQQVIRRIMSQLDAQLDEATRNKIMENCGRECYAGAHGERPVTSQAPNVEKFLVDP